MNWKLILRLSVFGPVTGIATVFFSSSTNRSFGLGVISTCAIIIAKRQTGKPFLHGLLVGLVGSVWATAVHVLLFDTYIARHAGEASMMQGMSQPPRLMMILAGPVIGLVSGLVIGFLAWAASRWFKPAPSS